MKPAINQIQETPNVPVTKELYDSYAAAVYGKILSIIPTTDIADKLLETIFIKSDMPDNIIHKSQTTPLISLLNQAREKSYRTIKALNILKESCAGASHHPNELNK